MNYITHILDRKYEVIVGAGMWVYVSRPDKSFNYIAGSTLLGIWKPKKINPADVNRVHSILNKHIDHEQTTDNHINDANNYITRDICPRASKGLNFGW